MAILSYISFKQYYWIFELSQLSNLISVNLRLGLINDWSYLRSNETEITLYRASVLNNGF